jgi:DNA modification methylase
VPVSDQVITNDYALYNGDCVEVVADLPSNSVDMAVYSPPFAGLFQYSGDERDMSNCTSPDQFYQQYGFLVDHLHRVTKPGRINAVHCMDIGLDAVGSVHDLPGNIVRLHEAAGFKFMGRRLKWNEPLAVRLRTMVKGLAHKTICDDSTQSSIANADYVLFFRKNGENKMPVRHERGFLRYFGEDSMPPEVLQFRGFEGDQKLNKFSHLVWRRYASSAWMDIRASNSQLCGDGLPAKAVVDDGEAREPDDIKHVHPLMLDIIHRCVELYTNPGETVLTPFMGVGSEVYSPVYLGRRGVGVELKKSYYRQAVKNVAMAKSDFVKDGAGDLLSIMMMTQNSAA